MSSIPKTGGSTGRGNAPAPVVWRSWPLVDGGHPGWPLVTMGVALSAAVFFTTGHVGWVLVAAAAFALATWRYFVPIVFEVDAMGVTQHAFGRQRRTPWNAIRRCEIDSRGVYLARSDLLTDTFRSLYLPTGPQHEQVVAAVRYYLPRLFAPEAPLPSREGDA